MSTGEAPRFDHLDRDRRLPLDVRAQQINKVFGAERRELSRWVIHELYAKAYGGVN